MYIAQQLKKSNIAEYLIYMWQAEDLIRACELDIDKIDQHIISKYRGGEEVRSALRKWYEDLINMMRDEGVTKKGHLQINNNVIINLTDLHNQLLRSSKVPFYNGAYYQALPLIVELRRRNAREDEPELLTCFDVVYGVMIMSLEQKTINTETVNALKTITNFLSMLANYYDKEQNGELDI